MASRYAIRLFGPPAALNSAGEPVPGLGLGKPLALLSYLLVEGRVPRETIIALLWGDVPELKARNAFRQALHRLRAALGEDVIPHDPDSLSIADGTDLTTDVAAFEQAIETGNFERAIAGYRGDFLLGLNVREAGFDAWQEKKRKTYKARYRDALRNGVQRDLETGELTRALDRAAALSESDPSDPDAAMLLATTLLGAGRRAEALHALDNFEKRFQEDFGGGAPATVRELSARLRRSPSSPEANRSARNRAGFVGRETELGLLLSQLTFVASGRGSMSVIEGEAGAGKTRLINEFYRRARDIGSPLLLYGRERAGNPAIAYASVGDALRGALDAPGISGTGQHLLAEAARLLPQLRDRFSLPEVGDIADETGTLRFYEGVAALLDSVAYEQPVCIALDDFHNCSSATIVLTHYLVDRLRSAPILFLIAGRSASAFSALRDRLVDSYADAAISSDEQGAHPGVITLGGLDPLAARTLALECLGPAADRATIDRIIAVSGGIPYRIEALSSSALAGEPLGDSPVPLRDVLWARLQRCSKAEQRLFVAAALLDRPVPIRLLAAASHLPEKSALDSALELERAGLLLQRAEGMVPVHDLAGELALEGAGPAGRALLAGWAGEALELDGSGTATELAGLFSLAGRRDRAFKYSRIAAQNALAAGALEEGLRHLENALATAPSDAERGEIAGLLQGLGRGAKRLPHTPTVPQPDGGDASPAQPESERPPANSMSSADSELAPSAKPSRRWRRNTIVVAGTIVIAVVAVKAIGGSAGAGAPGTSLVDSLIVGRELDRGGSTIEFTTGPLGSPLQPIAAAAIHPLAPAWIESIRVPWTNPLVSPDGRRVALERITKLGSDLYVVSRDRRDTLAMDVGNGDDFADGWSPDSRWLLATKGGLRGDGRYGASLYAYSAAEKGRRVAFDTSVSRAVVDAAWSPDGSHVAWTARVGNAHQQDILVSDADGGGVVNLTDDPAEDYSIAWSPDGSTLAFTSERSGRAELYSIDIRTRKLHRLTWEGAHADHSIFSPDGRWLAYESTRSGNPAVYVMPAFGGTGRAVAPLGDRVTLLGWRGRSIPYVDKLAFELPQMLNPGDSGSLVVSALDRGGRSLPAGNVRYKILDPLLIKASDRGMVTDSTERSQRITLIAGGRGLGRVAISSGNWRADTVFIPIGEERMTLLSDNFDAGLDRRIWRPLGDPAPRAAMGRGVKGTGGLVPNSDRQWESGVLSTRVFPVRGGLVAEAWVSAPFTTPPSKAQSFEIALVAADPEEVLDSLAPQFLRLARVSWLGDASRISYSIGGEVFTEPLSGLSQSESHMMTIAIGADRLVTFYVDGVNRWKSTLRVRTAGDNSRAQLWLASEATGRDVAFDEVSVRLQLTPIGPANK